MTTPSMQILSTIADYYTEKINVHGESARGVDWNGSESQQLRFEQICKIILPERHADFTLNDLGCGYGALFDYLLPRYENFRYIGYDISLAMLATAQRRHAGQSAASYRASAYPDMTANYTVASGVFNVRLTESDTNWLAHIKTTLDSIHSVSTRGFSFNCLTSYSDADKKRNDLYYADPCQMFDFCKRRYSRQVALLHDYGLYEFTILVRK